MSYLLFLEPVAFPPRMLVVTPCVLAAGFLRAPTRLGRLPVSGTHYYYACMCPLQVMKMLAPPGLSYALCSLALNDSLGVL